MPLPPHLLKAPAATPGGIQFTWLLDDYQENWAANGNQVVVGALVAWEDSSAWLREAVGFTTWDGSSATLNRTLPFACPTEDGLWLDSLQSVGRLAVGPGSSTADADNGNAPKADAIRYRCVFKRPPYWVRSDETLAGPDYDNYEQYRYTRHSFDYRPRERKVAAYSFEFNDAPDGSGTWHRTGDETNFIPDYQVEYLVTWMAVPIDAIPWGAIEAGLLTVNETQFYLGNGYSLNPGRSLFKGPQTPFEWYQDAAGEFVMDLTYKFAYQPGGWNYTLLKDRDPPGTGAKQYGPVRAHDVAPDTPPYAPFEHQNLFVPGWAAP